MVEREAPSRCPKCGGSNVAEILYGLPDFEALREDLEAGRIDLGGCCVFEGAPEWACQNCGHRWGAVEFLDTTSEEPAD